MFKWKRLLSVVAVILVLIIIQARNYNIDGPFRGLLGNIVNPVIYVADKAFSCVGNVWNSYVYLVNVQKRNEEYKRRMDDLTLENILLKEKVIHGERLQSFVRFYKSYDFNRIPCNVIGVSGGYVNNIVIDAGAVDGVEKNDPVIGFHGLVGKVTAVYAASSDVDVILNISSNVSVMNSRTRVTGILRGDGKGRLYVDYYDRLDEVTPGDIFITSGLGQLYPKGVRVGRVSEIIKDKTGLFQKVFIEQSEDFYKMENVFVVKDFKE